MLYNEFIEGTGCKDNDHNYQVYKELEIIYMNTDCTKTHIYEMGKKLVDNSKSEKELQFEAEIKEKIEAHKTIINEDKEWLERNQEMIDYFKAQGDKEMEKFYRNCAKHWKQEIKNHKNEIAKLKWVLA